MPVTEILATSVQDWIERLAPLVLFAFAAFVLALRHRERLRGPDDDDLDGFDERDR